MPKTDRSTPLFKRIKRHVIGRKREYFAVAPPGFEAQALEEIKALSPTVENIANTSGGIEFTAKLEQCWQASLCLRTVNRILMRIDTFKAARFDQLTLKLSDIPWELYLFPGQITEFHTSTAHCRLHHTGAIAERCGMAIDARFTELADTLPDPPKTPAEIAAMTPQKIFIRGANNRFTVSIDSSGEILYKRGIKTRSGQAPIRETLAAAILMRAGYRPGSPLIDPMCGVGTFSLEAALMARQTPAGNYREFAFMDWPSFLPKRWNYLKKELQNSPQPPDHALIFASDQDAEQIQAMKNSIKDYGLKNWIHASCKNFLSFSPKDVTDKRGLIVINPPYGVRIGAPEQSRALFGDICRHLKKNYRGWQAALIVPDKEWIQAVPFRPRIRSFIHGGLSLLLLTGRVSF